MVTHTLTAFSPKVVAVGGRARTQLVCRSCGGHFAAHPGERLAAVFCGDCLDRVDEPVTAEHAWELGGGG